MVRFSSPDEVITGILLDEVITGDSGNAYTATISSANLLGRKERIIEGTIEMRPEVTR